MEFRHSVNCLIASYREYWGVVAEEISDGRGERHSSDHSSSTEREREGLDTGIEELDLELAIGDRCRLSNQLIQALFGDRAFTVVVYVTSVVGARRLSID